MDFYGIVDTVLEFGVMTAIDWGWVLFLGGEDRSSRSGDRSSRDDALSSWWRDGIARSDALSSRKGEAFARGLTW